MGLVGEGGIDGFDPEFDGFADVFEIGVADEGTGEEPGFGEDLEAVADADDGAAFGREGFDGGDDGGEFGDGTAAEVIAVGKAAGKDDGVDVVGDGVVAMPEHLGPFPKIGRYAEMRIMITIGTGEDNYAEFHFLLG